MIDDDIQCREQVGDIMVKLDGVLDVQRLVIRNAKKNTVGAEVLDEVHLLDNFTWISAGDANEQRHAFFYGFDRCDGKGFEFVKKKIVALTVGSGGRNIIDAVFDNLLDGPFEIIHSHRLRCSDV